MAQGNAWYDRMDVIMKGGKKNGITLIELGMDYFLTPQRRSAGLTRGYCTSRDAHCMWATHTGNVHKVCRSVLHCKLLRIQASEWVRINKVLQGSCKILYCMWRRYRAPRDAGDCTICVGDKLEVWRGKKIMTGRFWPEICGLWWIKNTRQTLGRDLSPPVQLGMHDVWRKNDSNRRTVMKWTSKPKIHPSVPYHCSAHVGATGWCMTPVRNMKA